MRELIAVVEQAVVAAEGDTLEALHLIDGHGANDAESNIGPAPHKRRGRTGRPTRDALIAALVDHDGSVTKTAAAIGVGRKTVYRWLDALGIDADDVRGAKAP